jgi:Strictosidine synthase
MIPPNLPRHFFASVGIATVAYIVIAAHVARVLSPYDLSRSGLPTGFINTATPLPQNRQLRERLRTLLVGTLYGAEHILLQPGSADFAFAFPAEAAATSSAGLGGWLVRLISEGKADFKQVRTEKVVHIGGRVLGAQFHPTEPNVIIACDAMKGLLRIDIEDRTVNILSTIADDYSSPIRFCDDVAIAADGETVYFTDATDKALCAGQGESAKAGSYCHPHAQVTLDILRGRGAGRLLAYNFRTRRTRTLVSGLLFANGVAVMPDQRSVLVVETGSGRIYRYFIDNSGPTQLFAELPFFVDNIRLSGRGTLWVAGPNLFTPLTTLANRLPWLRWLIAQLPPFLWPPQPHTGMIVELSLEDGSVIRSLQDPSGEAVSGITSVAETPDGKTLLLGRLEGYGLAVVDL